MIEHGRIITFYSFKGGVGRSMALANTAVSLAASDNRVCVIDWDLEAPGIDNYFTEMGSSRSTPKYDTGILGILKNHDLNWPDYAIDVTFFDERLTLIPSGRSDENSESYAKRLQALDWDNFYSNSGGDFLEQLTEKLRLNFDFIFIDSRTGLTDAGGICTIQLPDILVIVFTANRQSILGAQEWADRARAHRQFLPYTKTDLTVVPLISRWDGTEEQLESDKWFHLIVELMGKYTTKWTSVEINKEKVFEQLRIPHVPYFSFGEKLAVTEHSVTDPALPGRAYVRLAALLQELDWRNSEAEADMLALRIGRLQERSRRFKNATIRGTLRIYVSAVYDELASYQKEISRVLRRKGIEVICQPYSHHGGKEQLNELKSSIKKCDAVICLIGDYCGSLPPESDMAVFSDNKWVGRFRSESAQSVVSYAQLEFLLAKSENKLIYVYMTTEDFIPDNKNMTEMSLNDQSQQLAYRKWIRSIGANWTPLTTVSKLTEDVLVLQLPDLSQKKINNLPLGSLGNLFKGREQFLQELNLELSQSVRGVTKRTEKSNPRRALGSLSMKLSCI